MHRRTLSGAWLREGSHFGAGRKKDPPCGVRSLAGAIGASSLVYPSALNGLSVALLAKFGSLPASLLRIQRCKRTGAGSAISTHGRHATWRDWVIDVDSEQVVLLAEACRLLPTRPSLSAVWRWKSKGVRGAKLETALIGGRRVTSVEALQRFVQATTEREMPTETRNWSSHGSPVQTAEAELDRFGVTSPRNLSAS